MSKQASKLKGYDNVFAIRLRGLMEERKITQDVLAERAGCSRQSISQYMDGSSVPNVDKLLNIADYFEVSTDYLLGITATPTNNKDLEFICDYTGLDMEVVQDLNSGITRIQNEGINFLMSRDKPSEQFFSMCCRLEDLKRAYTLLLEHKRKIIELYKNYTNNEESNYAILEELKCLENNRDLHLFKLQKIMNSFADLYCEREAIEDNEMNTEFQKAYEFLFYGGAFEFENCE